MNIVYHGSRTALVASLCGAQLLVVLDGLIVAVALPSIGNGLGLGTSGQQWVITAYLLTFGGLLIPIARAGDSFGHRRVLLSGLTVFVAASLVGGLASVGWVLIAARAIQGIGGAALATASLSMLLIHHPREQDRTRALAWWSATSGSAGALGLVLGGVLTDVFGWRSVMLISVPIGAVLMVAVTTSVPSEEAPRRRVRPNILSAVLATACVTTLVLALSQGGSSGWLSGRVWAAVAATVLSALAFVASERHSTTALIPKVVIRRRSVLVGVGLMVALSAIMTSTMIFLSMWLQHIDRFGPTKTGLGLLPMSLVIAVGSLVTKRLMTRFTLRTLLVTGALTTLCSLLWLSQVSPGTSYAAGILGAAVLWAAGVAIMSLPIVHLTTRDADPETVGAVSGLLQSTRQVAGAVGLAGLGAVVSTSTSPTVGYHRGFLGAAIISAAVALVAVVGIPAVRRPSSQSKHQSTQ